jgi:hypothetical protein
VNEVFASYPNAAIVRVTRWRTNDVVRSRTARTLAGALLALLLLPAAAGAQYFGRNKVQYRTFDFQILQTEHFDVYYYPEEAEAARMMARMAERWQDRLARFFGHELRGRQPLILYAVGAHFRQTNAVEGLIGEGTGGVTESIRRRVVLPMSGSLADSDHVLGHELVHAFQFDLTGDDPRDAAMQAPGILAFPLWFVEGMAEYLSLGPVDAQTAMWMRDAALREKLPSLRDLDNPKYFPYRWGHSFWAFVGAKYGDRAVASLVRSAANPRFDLAGLAGQLGTDPDTLTREWHDAIRLGAQQAADHLSPITSDARAIIHADEHTGRYNVGPEISPDGRRIAFFSERDRFSIELYLADAETGRITRRLLKTATDPHFDSLEFLNSAGAWSPDGRRLVLTAVRGGRPVLAFVNAASGEVVREQPLPGLDDAFNPAFAPDGQSIVLAGNAGGLLDLYLLSIETGTLTRLTNDAYADVEPEFTPDGRTVVFATERFSTDLATLEPGPLRLAKIDMATRQVTPIAAFLKGKHISPNVSADGRQVIFIADPDGISNLYRVSIDGGPVEQLTSLITGVAGITTTSPALSVSATGRMAFSVFENDGHSIYVLDPDRIVATVPAEANLQAAILPGRTTAGGDVERYLTNFARGLPPATAAASSEPYRQGLALDSIGQPTISGAVSQFGTEVSGGLSASFSDMLGDRALGMAASVGGTLADFGGEVFYLNRKHRWNWLASAGVTPYAVGFLTRNDDPVDGTVTLRRVIDRQSSRGVTGATIFPINAASRLEFSAGARQLVFRRDIRTAVYAGDSRSLLSTSNERVPSADPLYFAQMSAAFVRDTTYFGATAPLFGSRSRFEIGVSRGTLNYVTGLADWRRYFMPVRPFTIAVRAVQFGRYGANAEDGRLVPLYVGYPEFVHGYGIGSFSARECQAGGVGGDCPIFNQLIGSRLATANVELRVPLKGLMSGNIEYGRVPIDLVAFADAGMAWSSGDLPRWFGGSRDVVRSVGGAVRINVIGLLVVEVAASRPLDRVERGVQWQIGVREGF